MDSMSAWPDTPWNLAGSAHRDGHLPVQSAEVVIGRARALGGHHARADRGLRCAGRAEHLALPRLDHPLQDLAALARLGVGNPHTRNLERQLGVPWREL